MENLVARIIGCSFRMLRTLGGAEMDVEPLRTSIGLAFFLREGVEALRLLNLAHPEAIPTRSAIRLVMRLACSDELDTVEIANQLGFVVREMEETLD